MMACVRAWQAVAGRWAGREAVAAAQTRGGKRRIENKFRRGRGREKRVERAE